MLTFRQLTCFVAVARDLHFSRAADRLGLAQSAVSLQVQQLEHEIGVRLLQRNKRQRIMLTDAGELLLEEATVIVRHMERAQQIGELAAQGMGGNIRLGYVASAATSGLLATLLSRFRAGHEQVHMQVIAMETPRQLQALESAEIDVGIVRPRLRYPAGIASIIVHKEPLMIAMSENHALARNESLNARDMRDEKFIAPQFNETEGFVEVVARLAEAGGFSAAAAYRVNDFITAISLAAAGYGIAIVPESSRHFHQAGIAFRHLSDFQELLSLAMVYRQRESSPAVRAFFAEAQYSTAGATSTPPC